MKEVLKLKNAIMIDGKQVKELTYDYDKIDTDLLMQAETDAAKGKGSGSIGVIQLAENDPGLHLHMGFAAILADNPSYAKEDITRVKGFDLMEIMRTGRNFILGVGASSEDQNSESASEPTQSDSTPA